MKEYKTLQLNRTVIHLEKPPRIPSRYNVVGELKDVKTFQMKGQTLNVATKWSKNTRMNRLFIYT
jgi:hypothetical protein